MPNLQEGFYEKTAFDFGLRGKPRIVDVLLGL